MRLYRFGNFIFWSVAMTASVEAVGAGDASTKPPDSAIEKLQLLVGYSFPRFCVLISFLAYLIFSVLQVPKFSGTNVRMKDEKAVLGKIEAMVAGQLSQLQVCWIEAVRI